MPPPPWTSPAQRVFLWSHIVAFREAQEANTTDDYLAGVYEEWFLKYPQQDESQIPKDKKRVYDWLRNRATPSRYKGIGELAHQARCTIVQLLLNTVPPKKKKKPQPAHAFSHLYLGKGLREKLEAAYKAMKDDPTITPKPEQVVFYGKETRRLYKAASAEVKKEVEDYRNKVVADDLGDELERFLYEDEVYLDEAEKGRLAEGRQTQMAIDVLEPLLYEIAKTIEEVTGWKSHIMIGGPEPLRNGKITSIDIGSGRSIDKDESFKAYHPAYKLEVEDQFSGYLKKSFRPEQRAIFADIPFTNWAPALRSPGGLAQPLRTRSETGSKRKAKGTHEDDVRPRKKNGQTASSNEINNTIPPQMDYTPSAEDTQIDALEDNRPIPPIPTPTPVPESTTNLTSPQSCDLLAGQRPIEVEVEVDLSLPLSLRIVAKRVNRDGAESFKMASTGSWVTEYELERLKQMEKNRQLLVETMPVSASQILPVKPRKSTATTRQRRDRVKVTVQEKRTLPRRQARSERGTHAQPRDAQATSAPAGSAQSTTNNSASLAPQTTSNSASSAPQTISASSAPQIASSHEQTTRSPRHTVSTSNPFDTLDKLIPDASQRLGEISLDDEDDEDNEAPPLGFNYSGSTSLQIDDSLNSSSIFDSVRLLGTSEAATSPSVGTSSGELSPRSDRRSSDPITAPPLSSSVNDTRLDRRSNCFALPSLPTIVVSDGESDARLGRHLDTQPTVPSSDTYVSSSTNISFEFPAFTLSTLPPWLSGPVSHLSEQFCGQKELSVIKGLVALEHKWGLIDHKMDTEGRPDAVSWWLARGRPLDKHKMPLDLPVYGKKIRGWWKAHQPPFRLEGTATWPLSQAAPVDEAWDATRRGGKNGLLVFVMALYWWKLEAQSQDSEEAVSEFYSVVDDVLYVFQRMLVADQQSPSRDAGFSVSGSTKKLAAVECTASKSLRSSAGRVRDANKENERVTRSRVARH